MTEHLEVDAPDRLLGFLRRQLPGWKRKTIEQRIRAGCVRVNEALVTRPESPVAAGDAVSVVGAEEAAGAGAARPCPVPIVYEDDELLAVDKPAGLLSVSTDAGGERSALALVRSWLARPALPAQLWPAHRLDRETSGVLLFARSLAVRDALQRDWPRARKHYLAVVEGQLEPAQGAIDAPLWEDARLFVHVGTHPEARPARTRYATLRSARGRTLLEVELDTGRKHQIRAHLAWRGCPVVGDERYGTRGPRLGLHALRLIVVHPATGRELALEAPPPKAFTGLLP